MRILYISKYAVSPVFGDPTRQFFYCKYLSRQPATHVHLVSSASATCHLLQPFRGACVQQQYERLTHSVLNGPRISLGFSLKRIWSWLWFEFQIWRQFSRIRRWQPDVIIVSSLSILTFVTGLILKYILRRPLIIEVRDVYPETLISLAGYRSYHPLVIALACIEKTGYRRADAIVSSLPNLAPHVRHKLGHDKPVAYLPMGFDPEFYAPAPPSPKGQETIRQLQTLKDKFVVGYIGTIGLANALEEPLRAFRDLQRSHPNIHLVIVGDGPLSQKYQAEYSGLGNIHFFDRHPKSDLPYLLEHMQVVISPWLDRSIYQFGISPNKWIDYLAAAKPILACLSGFRFLLDEQRCGWFIPPQDCAAFQAGVIRAYQTPASELTAMGQRGQKYLKENLTYDVLAARLREIIDQVVAGPCGS
ncbi:MAG: glycosyltransferase family 4 protein [Pirellulaceae bacterium]|nr:glycosyltransferase family 4 protein [Pirellulaceae bacterium]